MQIEKDVQGVAATLLPYYDRHVGRYSPALATALVRVAGVGHGGRALDVGCGTGALAAALAALLGPARVAAVDRSQAAVEACAHAVPGADVRLANAERLPFADGEFAAVLAQLVIDKVDGPAALREMRRVARPGATVAACVWDFEARMTLLRAYWDAALAVDPRGARAAGAGGRPPYSRPEELHERRRRSCRHPDAPAPRAHLDVGEPDQHDLHARGRKRARVRETHARSSPPPPGAPPRSSGRRTARRLVMRVLIRHPVGLAST